MFDNIIIRALSRIFDFIVLNVLWLICSLPIVTIGASTTALYSVMLKIVKDEEGYIWKDFLKAFKSNFKQATVIWLILVAAGAIFGLDAYVLKGMKGIVGTAGFVLLGSAFLIYVMILMFVFPLTAKFENTTANMIKNAFLIPISRIAYAIAVVVLTLMCMIITFLTPTTIVTGIAIWSAIGVSLLAYANSFIILKMIEPYVGEESYE